MDPNFYILLNTFFCIHTLQDQLASVVNGLIAMITAIEKTLCFVQANLRVCLLSGGTLPLPLPLLLPFLAASPILLEMMVTTEVYCGRLTHVHLPTLGWQQVP